MLRYISVRDPTAVCASFWFTAEAGLWFSQFLDDLYFNLMELNLHPMCPEVTLRIALAVQWLWFRLPGTSLLSLCQTKATAMCSSSVFETSSSDEANLAALIFTEFPDLVVYASDDFSVKGAFDILLLCSSQGLLMMECVSVVFWHRWELGNSLNVHLKMDLCRPLLQAKTQYFAFGREAWSCHRLMLLNVL